MPKPPYRWNDEKMAFSNCTSTAYPTLTKNHEANPGGGPIISGCEGLTERILSFADSPLQPIDTTDLINFLENTEVPKNIILDVTSLYTNIPQEEGITTAVCNVYERFHSSKPLIPTHFLRDMLQLILKEISSLIKTAMETKMAVSIANLFISTIETEILNKSTEKPVVWKRYIDVFSVEHRH